jgi:hypothetical protein
MKFCEIDPLQHHGHFIIFKSDLNNFDESYLPVCSIKNAICVKGKKFISFNTNSILSKSGVKKNITENLKTIKTLFYKYEKDSINTYEMKQLVGSILITSPYLFQVAGKSFSKKTAIKNKRKIFSKNSCQFIDCCSEIRLNWRKVCIGPRYGLLKFLSKIIKNPRLFRFLSKKLSPKFQKELFCSLDILSFKNFILEVEKKYEQYNK